MRPDKAKVVDEIWDEERIRGFLDKTPMGDEADPDYSVLLYAYRSMRPGDFQTFIDLFCQQGRNLQALSNSGQTLLQTIAGHRKSAEFRDIIERAATR